MLRYKHQNVILFFFFFFLCRGKIFATKNWVLSSVDQFKACNYGWRSKSDNILNTLMTSFMSTFFSAAKQAVTSNKQCRFFSKILVEWLVCILGKKSMDA